MTATAAPMDETQARQVLDQQTVEMVQWHFHESTGSPFWLQKKAELNFDPLERGQVV